MIQAAMMFALGFSVCGLIALAVSSALARRTRRLAEHRVKQRYATKRLEFETERDELRARNAVDVQRLERDIRETGDKATSYRLEAALKDIEINTLNSELDSKEEEIEELGDRLDELHAQLRESERSLAESGAALRAAQHALDRKTSDESFGYNPFAQSGNGRETAAPVFAISPAWSIQDNAEADGDDQPDPERPISPEAENIRKVAMEIRRIAKDTETEAGHLFKRNGSVVPDQRDRAEKRMPPADPEISARPPPSAIHPIAKAVSSVEMFDPRRREVPPTVKGKADGTGAESRFLEAMDQIRTLKSAGGGDAAE